MQKRAVELCPPHGQAGHRRHADARVDDRRSRCPPAPRPPTSPTPCSTAPTPSCSRARPASASTRSWSSRRWPASSRTSRTLTSARTLRPWHRPDRAARSRTRPPTSASGSTQVPHRLHPDRRLDPPRLAVAPAHPDAGVHAEPADPQPARADLGRRDLPRRARSQHTDEMVVQVDEVLLAIGRATTATTSSSSPARPPASPAPPTPCACTRSAARPRAAASSRLPCTSGARSRATGTEPRRTARVAPPSPVSPWETGTNAQGGGRAGPGSPICPWGDGWRREPAEVRAKPDGDRAKPDGDRAKPDGDRAGRGLVRRGGLRRRTRVPMLQTPFKPVQRGGEGVDDGSRPRARRP